jgi:hypothetical protein
MMGSTSTPALVSGFFVEDICHGNTEENDEPVYQLRNSLLLGGHSLFKEY